MAYIISETSKLKGGLGGPRCLGALKPFMPALSQNARIRFLFFLLLSSLSAVWPRQAQGQPVRGASAPARSSVSLEVSTGVGLRYAPSLSPSRSAPLAAGQRDTGTDGGASSPM